MEKELKTDFIPELYDKAMEKVFDERYYGASDEDEGSATAKDLTVRLIKDQDPEAAGEEDDGEEQYERELAKPVTRQVEEGYDTWFACDGCQRAIEGGDYRFDCTTCDNFCFCEKCYRKNKDHLHKFTRQKVPVTQKPPKNSRDLIAKAYMLCSGCGECLLEASKSAFVCQTCTSDFMRGDTVYFCLKCKKAGTHEHKLQKLKAVPGELAAEQLMKQDKAEMNEEEKKSYLEGLLDEYYNLDFEDVIGGGSVKTRFKY